MNKKTAVHGLLGLSLLAAFSQSACTETTKPNQDVNTSALSLEKQIDQALNPEQIIIYRGEEGNRTMQPANSSAVYPVDPQR